MTTMSRKPYKQVWTPVQTQEAQLDLFKELSGKAITIEPKAGEGQNQVISPNQANKSKQGPGKSKETGNCPKTQR